MPLLRPYLKLHRLHIKIYRDRLCLGLAVHLYGDSRQVIYKSRRKFKNSTAVCICMFLGKKLIGYVK